MPIDLSALPRIEEFDLIIPPTEDELPYDDGMPMETSRHFNQMSLLIEVIQIAWRDQPSGFVGGNMFVYFSLEQARNQDFRGPDFFAVLDVPKRERKSWVVWQEGKGPDVVIELLSESTARKDRTEKKQVYQDVLRVPEYFWFDPFGGELAGFTLCDGVYVPVEPDAQGRLVSQRLGLALVRWQGAYRDVETEWLRWATLDGQILPTGAELGEAAQREAEAAQREAEAAQREAEAAQREMMAAQQRAAEMEALLAEYRRRFGDVHAGE